MVHKILKFIFRLFVGAIIWVGMGILALLSALPYGGGSKGLMAIWLFSTIAVLIWAIAAFFSEAEIKNASDEEIQPELTWAEIMQLKKEQKVEADK